MLCGHKMNQAYFTGPRPAQSFITDCIQLFNNIYKSKFITRILNNRTTTLDYFSLNVSFVFKCCTTHNTELFVSKQFRNLQFTQFTCTANEQDQSSNYQVSTNQAIMLHRIQILNVHSKNDL